MASAFLRVVFNNLPPIIRSHHLWTIIWCVSLLIFYPKILLNRAIFYVLIYGFFLFVALETIWNNIDDWNYRRLLFEFYEIAIGVSVITYFQQTRDFLSLAKITKWTMVFLFITAIMTLISALIDPMYARNITAISSVLNESEREAVLSFQVYGGGTYSTAATFMCLFPVLIYYFKNIKISLLSKPQIIVLAVIFFLALLGMQIFGNVLIAFIFSLIALVGLKKLKLSILVIALLFSILLILPKEIYVKSLISIGNNFKEDSDLNYKFNDLATFVETGANLKDNSTGVGGRAERYPMLKDAFMRSPLLGCYFFSDKNGNNYNLEGAHLYWMNKLTITGILGLLLFFFIPYNFIKNNIRQFDTRYKLYYLLAALSIISYGFIKAVGGRETWYSFFIILPGLYYLPLLKKKDNNNNS
jgi:hypothetical protein